MILLAPPSAEELHRRYAADLDLPAEARALYVAMTRARQDLYHANPPKLPHFRRTDSRGDGRRYLGGWQSYKRFGIVAEAGDVDRDDPPGAEGAPATSSRTFWNGSHPGTP